MDFLQHASFYVSRLETMLGSLAPKTMLLVRRLIGYGVEPEQALVGRFCNQELQAVDIGANAGMYTYHMLKHAKSVVAFEPNPLYARRLQRSFDQRVQVHAVALSDVASRGQLRIPMGINGAGTLEAGNNFGGAYGSEHIEQFDVPMQRLDDFALSGVSFIKIDVEGYELTVLKGATQTIKSNRPALLIEIEERHKAGNITEVSAFLAEFGYQGFFYEGQRLHPIETFRANIHQSVANLKTRYINNFLFLTTDQCGHIKDLILV